MSKRCCQVFFHLFFFLWPFLFISFYLLWATTEGATFLRVPITHHSPLAFLRAHLSCILVVPLLTHMQWWHSDHTEDVHPFMQSTAPPWSRAMRSGGLRLLPSSVLTAPLPSQLWTKPCWAHQLWGTEPQHGLGELEVLRKDHSPNGGFWKRAHMRVMVFL